LVVNSSQGGGSKDTWVVDTRRAQPAGTTGEPPGPTPDADPAGDAVPDQP
jgi:hypothetical protein